VGAYFIAAESRNVRLNTAEVATAIACCIKAGADLSEQTDLSSREAWEVGQTRELICAIVRKLSCAANFPRRDGYMIREEDFRKPGLSPGVHALLCGALYGAVLGGGVGFLIGVNWY
jgi:hypothetical protein